MNIAEMAEGQQGRISAIATDSPELEAKLREIGFCEGDEVQLLSVGPLGGQPLAVRLNRRVIAMRKNEASAVIVKSD